MLRCLCWTREISSGYSRSCRSLQARRETPGLSANVETCWLRPKPRQKVPEYPREWSCPGSVDGELLSEGHCTASEGDSEVAPRWSIVAPEVTVRSSLAVDRSKIMGDR